MIPSIRFLVLCCFSLFALAAENESFDVVAYGGTAGGTLAAAREGVSVVLLEPGGHLGGMLTGGLGRTDMDRQQQVIGRLALQFFRETGKHYGQDLAWTFEPKVAEKILNSWVEDAGVEVRFHHRLAAVEENANQIRTIQMLNGAAFEARVFIDSSYEGDLMARTGVMIMGQSAGVAAAMAVEKGLPVHKVGLLQLQRKLQGLGQILSLE